MGRVHSLQQLGRAGSQFSATSGLCLPAPPFPGEGPLKATPEPSVAQSTASASCSDFKEAAWGGEKFTGTEGSCGVSGWCLSLKSWPSATASRTGVGVCELGHLAAWVYVYMCTAGLAVVG